MIYKILKNGIEINTIVADESFCREYCEANSYTYEAVLEPNPKPESTPTTEERVAELETENKLLSQQIAALTDQNDFQEELIVELANVVYA